MKGLITKEFLYLRRQSKSVLLIFGIFVVFFFALSGAGDQRENLRESAAGIAVAVPVMLTIVLTINATAYDEQAKWDAYVLSLPVSRERIVAARYLSTALLSLTGGGVALLAGLFLLDGLTDPQGLLIIVAASFACPLLLCSILFPLFFRFGLQKARLAIAAIFLLPAAFGLLSNRVSLSFSGAQQALFWKLLPVLAVALVVISYLISCAVYRRKQV